MTLKDYFLLTTQWDLYYNQYKVIWLTSFQDDITNAHCDIGRLNDTLIISFRGTKDWRDVLADLMAFKMIIPYEGVNPLIKVHAGFLAYYMTLRSQILDFVKNQHLYSRVLVLGHSLGGAMATLCAVDIQYNFPSIPVDNIEGIVFGSPRVGNVFFKKSFLGRVKKFTNVQMCYDIVPRVPPWLWGYRTIAQSLVIIKEKHCPFDIPYNHTRYDLYLT